MNLNTEAHENIWIFMETFYEYIYILLSFVLRRIYVF